MVRAKKKGKNFVTTVDCPLLDVSGSASNIRFICKELLVKMTKYVEKRSQLVEEIILAHDEALIALSLPLSFGSSKTTKKRRRSLKIPPSALMQPGAATAYLESLPTKIKNWGAVPFYHIPYGCNVDHQRAVVVLGVGPAEPAGSHSLVQFLDDLSIKEVHREKELHMIKVESLGMIHEMVNEHERKQLLRGKPDDVHEKYWDQRYRIFSRFDHGILLDAESWYSVTYESIGNEIARLCVEQAALQDVKLHVVWDMFSGCGGTAIPLCRHGLHTTAIDIDHAKLNSLKHNSIIYGVEGYLELVQQDVWQAIRDHLCASQWISALADLRRLDSNYAELPSESFVSRKRGGEKSIDLMVLCPPWGGPEYLNAEVWDMQTMVPCGDGVLMSIMAACAAKNIVLVLPRNTSSAQINLICKCLKMKYYTERMCLNAKVKLLAVYIGPLFSHIH